MQSINNSIEIKPLINMPRQIVWNKGAVLHLSNISFGDIRSSLNGVECYLMQFNDSQIKVYPSNYPESDIEILPSYTKAYEELVLNAEIYVDEWKPFDIVKSFSYTDNEDDKIKTLVKHFIPSYTELMKFYYDFQWNMTRDENPPVPLDILDSMEKEIKELRAKIESKFSGNEYSRYCM